MTQFAQIIGQKFVKPNQSAIILSLEAVFGAIFSVIMGAETLSFGLILGFVAVFGAVLISELKPDIKKIFSKSKSDNKGDDAILENSGDAISKSE
jgi:drug/metabolite transporter (DMT)-like permease